MTVGGLIESLSRFKFESEIYFQWRDKDGTWCMGGPKIAVIPGSTPTMVVFQILHPDRQETELP
jgi:hypothetical protein